MILKLTGSNWSEVIVQEGMTKDEQVAQLGSWLKPYAEAGWTEAAERGEVAKFHAPFHSAHFHPNGDLTIYESLKRYEYRRAMEGGAQ